MPDHRLPDPLTQRIHQLEERLQRHDAIKNELTQGIPLYRFIVENSHVGIVVINEQYQIVYGNNEIAAITGYPLDEIIGRDFREVIVNAGQDEKTEANSRRRKGEILPYRFEAWAENTDGTRKTVEVSVAATNSFADQALSVVQVFDITERKAMESALQKSRQKYYDLFHNVSDIIYIFDLDGVFIETNAKYVIEQGGTRNFLEGKNIREFLPEPYHPEFDSFRDRILKNGKDAGLITIQIPSGGKRVLEYRNSLIRSEEGTPIGVWGSARDITEHLRDQKALAAGEEKYRTIVETIEDNYFELNLSGEMVFFNPELAKNLGYAPEELRGMHYRRYIHPEDMERAEALFLNVYKTGKTGRGFYYRAVKKSGEILHIETTCTLIRDSNGKAIGYRGISRDITERKAAEIQLKESEQRLREMHGALEEKVKERTLGLEEANIAMKVLLKKRDEDRRDTEDQMLVNIREMVLPYVERLKTSPLKENQKIYLEIIERNLLDIASPFVRGLSESFHKLTPSEIQIITLIKQNKSSKEIADFLNISPRTIEFHRDNIRKKLGIKNRKINLRSYLQSIG